MDAIIEHLDTQYEIVFSEPLFDLPKRDTEVLRNFYRSLQQSKYLVPPSDMRVVGGTAFSDIKIRIVMFGDLATIDLMADKMSIEFKQLKNLEHLHIYEACIGVSERAIRTTYPELAMSMTSLSCAAQIKMKESKGMRQFLKNVVGHGNDVDLNEFGDVEHFPAANTTVLNEEKGWNAVFHAFSVIPDESRLVASCRLLYTEAGINQGLDDRLHEYGSQARTLKKLFLTLIEGIGINLIGHTWQERKGENSGT